MTTAVNDPHVDQNADALIAQISQGLSTNGWDVVCSYALAPINKALAQNYASNKLVDALTLTVQGESPLGGTFSAVYNLVLGAPELTFLAGQSGQVLLQMPLKSGNYIVTPQGAPARPEVILPSDVYMISVVLPLVAVQGDAGAPASPPVPAGTIINFGPSQPSSASVTLHFTTSPGNAWAITAPPSGTKPPPPTPDPQLENLQTYLMPELANYFQYQVAGIEYTLASVNNHAPSMLGGSDTLVIQPAAFIFATSGTDSDGALSLYIQTSNSGNPPGDPAPSFQPGGTSTLPVPSDYTASLILSRDFLQRVYLLPQLAKAGFISVTASTAGTASEGLGATVVATYNSTHDVPRNVAGYDNTTITFNPFTLDFTQAPYTFSLTAKHLLASMTLQTSHDWNSEWLDGAGDYGSDSGTATVTVSLASSLDLSTISKVTPDGFTLAFTLDESAYAIDGSSGISSSWWNDHLGGAVEDNLLKYLAGAFPTFSFDLGGLNVLATTNLIFPGQNILAFATDRPIAVPSDLVLFANIQPVTGA